MIYCEVDICVNTALDEKTRDGHSLCLEHMNFLNVHISKQIKNWYLECCWCGDFVTVGYYCELKSHRCVSCESCLKIQKPWKEKMYKKFFALYCCKCKVFHRQKLTYSTSRDYEPGKCSRKRFERLCFHCGRFLASKNVVCLCGQKNITSEQK
jgi:hypothetical protein